LAYFRPSIPCVIWWQLRVTHCNFFNLTGIPPSLCRETPGQDFQHLDHLQVLWSLLRADLDKPSYSPGKLCNTRGPFYSVLDSNLVSSNTRWKWCQIQSYAIIQFCFFSRKERIYRLPKGAHQKKDQFKVYLFSFVIVFQNKYHPESEDMEDVPLSCDFCSDTFVQSNAYYVHANQKHSGDDNATKHFYVRFE